MPEYLDAISVMPAAALGLKKLISTASLSMRVRRSSDNSELDIGFTGKDLDVAALTAFIGAGSGFVRTIYDQTGNGHHAQQATAAKQAAIATGGVPLNKITLDGVDDAYQIISLPFGTQFIGLYGSLGFTPDGSARIIMESSANYIPNAHTFVAYANSGEGGLVLGSHATESNAVRSRSFPVSGEGPWSLLYDRSLTGSNEIRAWRGGTALTGTNIGVTEQAGSFAPWPLNIGARNGSSLYSALQIGTLAIYFADSSAERAKIAGVV